MTDIMTKSYGLDQIFIQFKKTPYGPGDLGDKLYVQNPVGDMIVFYKIKDLGFVDVAGIGQRMEDPVRVNREILAVSQLDFGVGTSPHSMAA
jgi:hypothetical protein